MNKAMSRRPSVRDLIYRQLESDIISGALRAGQEIDTKAIANHWGVSRTPVNQALLMLEANNLIEFALKGQPHVRRLTPKEVADTYFILATLESMMARLGAENLETTDLARMKGLLVEAEALVESGEFAAFREATLHFREVLYDRCGNRRLMELVNSLWVQVRALGTWLLSQPGLASSRLDRDRRILRASESGDVDVVQQLVYEGVMLAGERIERHLLEEANSVDHSETSDS